MSDLRMYCIFSRESIKKMGGNRGKLSSMAGHGFLHAFWDVENRFGEDAYPTKGGLGGDYPLGSGYYIYKYQRLIKAYKSGNAKKITLVVETDAELEEIYAKYSPEMGATRVVDSALTVFTEPTLACIGLGPCEQLDIPGSKVLI